MATSVANDTTTKGASAKASAVAKPDVEKIMADIRRAARARADDGMKSEREFKADVKKRMLMPLGSRGFSDEFADQIRSRDASRWNIQLTAKQFHGSAFVLMRVFRWFFKPLARLFVNVHPAVQQAARQAEINEYHRRLLWATNRDLELARLEINVIKTELRRLGVHADFSFSSGSAGAEGSGRGAGSGRGRQDSRGGRSDRGRGDRRRGDGGRTDREGRDRRERQTSTPGSRPGGGQSSRQNPRQGGRPNRGGRRATNGAPSGDK